MSERSLSLERARPITRKSTAYHLKDGRIIYFESNGYEPFSVPYFLTDSSTRSSLVLVVRLHPERLCRFPSKPRTGLQMSEWPPKSETRVPLIRDQRGVTSSLVTQFDQLGFDCRLSFSPRIGERVYDPRDAPPATRAGWLAKNSSCSDSDLRETDSLVRRNLGDVQRPGRLPPAFRRWAGQKGSALRGALHRFPCVTQGAGEHASSGLSGRPCLDGSGGGW